jgi:glutathione S-transferase
VSMNLREQLAALEHEQWIAWSQDIAATEVITPARLERWQRLWKPYDTLTEDEKDQDREWADRMITILQDFITRDPYINKSSLITINSHALNTIDIAALAQQVSKMIEQQTMRRHRLK